MSALIRLLPFETLSGSANMAADEALLESAGAGVASLRFYAWSEPTLSLGYFQPAAVRFSDPKLVRLPWVRRPTGGAALVHDREVTYALGLPAGPPWQVRGENWVCRFHQIITSALEAAGATTSSVQCGEEQRLGDVLCFQHYTPGDLVAEAGKVVGSAQRKRMGALLQHGGILLARSGFAPQLPGLAELTGVRFTPSDVAKRVNEHFAHDTGWRMQPGEWTAEEERRRRLSEQEKYASAEWNERR